MYVATGSRDKVIKLWDALSGQLIRNLVGAMLSYFLKSIHLHVFTSQVTITGSEPLYSTQQENIFYLALTTSRFVCGSYRQVDVLRPSRRTRTSSLPWLGVGRRWVVGLNPMELRLALPRKRKNVSTYSRQGASIRRSKYGRLDDVRRCWSLWITITSPS